MFGDPVQVLLCILAAWTKVPNGYGLQEGSSTGAGESTRGARCSRDIEERTCTTATSGAAVARKLILWPATQPQHTSASVMGVVGGRGTSCQLLYDKWHRLVRQSVQSKTCCAQFCSSCQRRQTNLYPRACFYPRAN